MTYTNHNRRFKSTIFGLAAALTVGLPFANAADDSAISLWEERTESLLDSETRLAASDVTGWNLYSGDEKLGGVSDLVIDTDSGEITHAIISTGGVLGMGTTDRVVSIDNIRFSAAEERAEFNATKAQLEQMPEFESEGFFSRSSSERRVDRDPAYQPAGSTPASRAETAASPSRQTSENVGASRADDTSPTGVASSEQRDRDYAASERRARDSDRLARADDKARDKAQKAGDKMVKHEGKLAGKGKMLSSDFIGMDIVDEAGQDIGNVNELLISANGQEIEYVVISAGGFMNIGDSKLALPIGALSFNEYEERAELPISRAALESADQSAKDWLSGIFN